MSVVQSQGSVIFFETDPKVVFEIYFKTESLKKPYCQNVDNFRNFLKLAFLKMETINVEQAKLRIFLS